MIVMVKNVGEGNAYSNAGGTPDSSGNAEDNVSEKFESRLQQL